MQPMAIEATSFISLFFKGFFYIRLYSLGYSLLIKWIQFDMELHCTEAWAEIA